MKYFNKRKAAFSFAFKGLWRLIKDEDHAKIHLLAAVCVIVAGFVFKVSPIEWCVICLCIGAVFTAEAFNTALERLADKVTRERSTLIGAAKDIAAAAVLIAAVTSVVIAGIIFIPKIF